MSADAFMFSAYSSFFLISSGVRGDRSAGAISNSVLQPKNPRTFIRPIARAQATSTEAVNSGLESSFRENSITCLCFPPSPVAPLRITCPPWGRAL